MNIEWKDEYSVEVKEIDLQHKELLGFLNVYADAISTDAENAIKTVVQQMDEYGLRHFKTEEKYFHKFNYEHTAEHEESHRNYLKKIAPFKERMKNKDPEQTLKLAYDILDFLEDWWVTHLMHEDHMYIDCFNEHGLN